MSADDSLLADSQHGGDPSVIASLTPAQKERLSDLLDRYLASLESNAPFDQEALLRDNPELAEPLAIYMASLAHLHVAAVNFEVPAKSSPATPAETNDQRRLGDYLLGRVIGRGGMGVVYEARQESLDRPVAVKVLPFAAVLDARQIARFKNEAQAAARLRHPNIVPVYAVGVDRGVHYYAMQLINGAPLDRLIASLRGADNMLPVESRASTLAGSTEVADQSLDEPTPQFDAGSHTYLSDKRTHRREYFRAVAQLGIQVAEALHAAHSEGIVHRDIKPSNLLLNAEGMAWITDFGLARCETELALTRTGDVVGTRRYMSPEQAAGDAALIDQRTDIYSLAVTLYELITLRPAYQDDAQRFRGDSHEPIRPRQLEPQLAINLETVILKGMSSAREDRYLTAQAFADDLRRFLEGKPIVARPPTVSDRLGKWAKRHARLLSGVAAASLLAVVGLAISALLISREQHRTEQNFTRADHYFHKAQGAVDRFGARVAERLSGISGAETVRRELLQETLQYYQDFVRDAERDPTLRSDLAVTYNKIGALAGELGLPEESITAHENATRLLEQLSGEEPNIADHIRRLAISKNDLAQALRGVGKTEDAKKLFQVVIESQQRLCPEFPDEPKYQADLARTHNNLGMLLSETGETGEAEREFRQAIKLQQPFAHGDSAEADSLRDLATSYSNLASLVVSTDASAAARMQTEAVNYQIRAVQASPGNVAYEGELAAILNNLGAAESRSGELKSAAEAYGRAVDIQRRLVEVAPTNRAYRLDLSRTLNNLGLAQSKLELLVQAEQSFRLALTNEESLAAQNPTDIELAFSLGGIHNNLGFVQETLNRLDDALASYRRAIEYQTQTYRRAPTIERYRGYLNNHYVNYARALRLKGHADEAAKVALRRKQLWPADPGRLYSIAEELALATKGLEKQRGANMTTDECADLAINTLREAVAVGYQLPPDAAQSETFTALRAYPKFNALVNR